MSLLAAGPARAQFMATAPEQIGSGDGRIHVIPTLSTTELKNGEKLTISAVIKSTAAVASVEAEIEGLETIELRAAPAALGGIGPDARLGLWQAEWEGRDLEKKYYTVTLRVTDVTGHTFEDASLRFSDPIAGINVAGTTAYPNFALSRIGSDVFGAEDQPIGAAVIDAAGGFAYFGTDTSPGIVIKVALGSGSNPPSRVGAVTLNTGENGLFRAVIDTSAGYAYFGTLTSPGIVVKIALGAGAEPPTRVGAVTLNAGEDNLYSSVIDTSNGYAYFGTQTSPGIVVKVDLGAGVGAPTRVGAVTLNVGEDILQSGVIDPANGYAYFGTLTSPGIVVKVDLGAGAALPTRVDAVALSGGENNLISAVIDTGGGHAYFGTQTSPGVVIKVALGAGAAAPTRVDAALLAAGENNLWGAAIDTSGGHAYFGTLTSPGIVVKVALGAGAGAPSRVGVLSLNSGENNILGAVVDASGGHAYFSTQTSPGIIVKVALGAGAALPTRIGAATLSSQVDKVVSAVIDASAGYAYLGTNTSPGQVIKVALGSESARPTRVGTLTLNAGENQLFRAVIDPAAGFAYFVTLTSPGIVVKVALGAGSAAPTRIGAVALNAGENLPAAAVIDTSGGHAYFGTFTNPGIVVKVALGAGASVPTRVDAVALSGGEDGLVSGVIDSANGFAYFGTNTAPGIVVKVALGAGAAAPTRVGAVTLAGGENLLFSSAIDTSAGYAYFGTNGTVPGRVIKVDLGGAGAPTRIGAIILNAGEDNLLSAVIDPAGGHAYFGTKTIPARVVKVALGAGAGAPTRVGAITLGAGENDFESAAIDPANGHAYFGTQTTPGQVVKLSYSHVGFLKGTKITLAQSSDVTDIDFYSHAALGNVRLAIYDDAEPKNLLWESASTVVAASGTFLSIPISSTAPSPLTIPAGTYWLAWQVDSGADVPSFTAGGAGSGFEIRRSFGSFQASLAAGDIASGSDTWSEFITFVPSAPEIDVAPVAVALGNRDIDAGATAPSAVVISNVGTATLNFTGAQVALAGANPGDFAITGDSLEATLAPGASRTVNVAFDPTALGARSANLAITSDDADEATVNVAISGTGTDQEIDVSPLGLIAFGDQDTSGGPTPFVAVTIANVGTGQLGFTGAQVEITGVQAPHFTIVADSGEAILAPAASRTVNVAFDPVTVGSWSANLTITSDDTDEPIVNVLLTGNGALLPEVSVSEGGTPIPDGGGPIDYGTFFPTAVPPIRTFTVSNSGNSTLTMSNLTVPAGFIIVEPLAGSLATGESDTFTVALSTDFVGMFAGSISFDNNDQDENPYDFTVTGDIRLPVPAIGQWGRMILILILLCAGVFAISRRGLM